MRAKQSTRPDNDDVLGPLGSTDVNGGDLAVQHWQNRRKQADARSFLAWSERSAPPPPKEPEPKPRPGSNDDLMGEVGGTLMPLNIEERMRRQNNAEIRQAIAELSADEPEENEFDRTRAALAPYEPQPREDDNEEESY